MTMRGLLSAGLKRLTPKEESSREAGFAPGERQAQVIAVAAQKGGVGKTTTAVNLACALALEQRQQVLVVDIDPQGHVAASLRESLKTGGPTLSEVLLSPRPRDLLEAVCETAISGLSLTQADKQLNETEALLSTRVGREFILRGTMGTARTRFDTILIDCPPNLGNLTLNALVAADCVLIPTDMSILAFEGVADLLATVETVNLRLRHELDVLGILRTRVDSRNRQINDTIGESLVANYGEFLLDAAIPVNSALARAQTQGLSIFQFEPRSRGALAYAALAQEVVGRLSARRS